MLVKPSTEPSCKVLGGLLKLSLTFKKKPTQTIFPLQHMNRLAKLSLMPEHRNGHEHRHGAAATAVPQFTVPTLEHALSPSTRHSCLHRSSTCSQKAAHSSTGTLQTATAMETSFPSKAILLSSALFPWGLKRDEKMTCRTESLVCSWK